MKFKYLSTGFIVFLLFTVSISAQKMHEIKLNKDSVNMVNPLTVDAISGNTVKFVSTGGKFRIFIENAIKIFDIDEANINIELDDATNPESEIYVCKDVTQDFFKVYFIICLTNGETPDAPPIIIIRSAD